MPETPAHLNRRALLRGAAALGAGIAGAGALSAGGARAAAVRSASSGHIDLSQTPKLFWNQRKLASTDSVMQSFTFDQAEKVLYTAQITAPATGDLLLTRFTLGHGDHWTMTGKMNVQFAGHGVAIAAHNGRLWTEADADLAHAGKKEGAFGRRLASFKFSENGVNLMPGAQGHGVFHPEAFYLPRTGVDQYTCAIDPTPGKERLVTRYRKGTGKTAKHYIEVFTLADALAHRWNDPVFHLLQPDVVGDFQGYTAMGNYLYLVSGTAKDVANPIPPCLYCCDMRTGEVVQSFGTTAGHNLDHWEPEGLAAYYPSGHTPRLFFGFATGKLHHRTATLYYKDRMTS